MRLLRDQTPNPLFGEEEGGNMGRPLMKSCSLVEALALGFPDLSLSINRRKAGNSLRGLSPVTRK